MKAHFGLVFFATGWGPTEGGINSFNFDLCCALGKIARKRSAIVFCICPGTTTEKEKQNAENNNVILIDVNDSDFKNCSFEMIVSGNILPRCKKVYWIGHDIITGKQAITCKERYKNKFTNKAVIIHHMNYSEYYSIGSSERTSICEIKVKDQEDIFKNSDYAIAVGPKLYKSLEDLLAKTGSDIPFTSIIPGLAEIEPIQKELNAKTILFTGRLEKDNDPIKQFSIPLYAISDLFKNNEATLGQVELKLYGLNSENEADLNKKVKELKCKASKRAGCEVPVKPLKYTPDRSSLFCAVKNSSITVMPSISEGFGLAGLESIAAGVPTIISKNSGLYEFLESENLNGLVEVISIRGGATDSPNEIDVNACRSSILQILQQYKKFKDKALLLRKQLLDNGFTWDRTALSVCDFLKICETNDFVERVSGLISEDIWNKYGEEFVSIIESCADSFACKIADELKINKQAVLSLKVDNVSGILNAIMAISPENSNSSLYYRQRNNVSKITCDFLKQSLTKIIFKLKNNIDTNDFENVLIDFISLEKESKSIYKTDKSNEYLNEPFRFNERNIYNDINNTIKDVKIDALLSRADKTVLKNYHSGLKDKYNVLNFDGLSVMASSGVQNIPLNRVYASMCLESERRHNLFEFSSIEENELFLLDRYDRVIIKGEPGSGKSTYLKNQLLKSCDSEKKYMYVFFKISEFSKWIAESEESDKSKRLYDYIVHVLSNDKNFDVELMNIYQKLRAVGGVAYFIDGLDEVQNSEQKRQINQMLLSFVNDAKECKYLMTSRKVGLDEELFKSIEFTIEDIAPLSKRSIESYIKKWYDVVGKIPGYENRDCKQLAERLIMSINSKNNSQLLNLAGNPLLLSIIVILHHHGINPPNNRTKLYSEITKTLLETWIVNRNFEMKYPTEYLTNFFSRVAFEIVTNDYNTMTIPEMKLKVMYEEYLNEQDFNDEDSVERFIQYISGDTGMFTCQGILKDDNLYGFLMHRQITEYYAAIALENKLHCKEIDFSSIINESKWTEVSILMGGYMSLQGEAGQNRANSFIKKLFKTKSRPIEDFKNNVLLILKWISNSTFIKKENLDTLFEELELIFKSPNFYRVLQFCEDVVGALNNDQFKKRFRNFISDLIDSKDFSTVRNVSVIINALLKNKELYDSILQEITDERIISSLKLLIEKNYFNRLVKKTGCYYYLFMDYFIKCNNEFYNESLEPKTKSLWQRYTKNYASAVQDRDLGYSFDNVMPKLIKLLENIRNNEIETFKNETVLNEYVQMLVLYSVAFEIAEGFEKTTPALKEFCENAEKWNCKSLIDSAIALSEANEENIGRLSVIYIDSGMTIFHNKNENGHRLTIYAYNAENRILEKFDVNIKKEICLDDIQNQLDEKHINLSVFNCLDQLSEIEMTPEQLTEIFNKAYDLGVLLTNKDWYKVLLEKMIEDKELFYKRYETFKRSIKFNGKEIKSSRLSDELKLYYKFCTEKRKQFTGAEIKKLICLYNKENDQYHKNVIYDILYDVLHGESEMY